jgi:hypothetical protein
VSTAATNLDRTFTATLEKSTAKGGWTYLVTDRTAEFFATHKLPIRAELRRRLAREAGDRVTVHLTERIERAARP